MPDDTTAPDTAAPQGREDEVFTACGHLAHMPREELRKQALEQVMRLTTDEALVLRFLTELPIEKAAIVVGKTLAALDLALSPGDPLLAYGAGGPLDIGWRKHYPPAEKSLFAELLFCRQMAGIAPGDEEVDMDSFEVLEHLRENLDFPCIDQY